MVHLTGTSRVKCAVALVSIAALLTFPIATSATGSTTRTRVVERSYDGFRGISVAGNYIAPTLPGQYSIELQMRRGERFVRVEIDDESAEHVIAWVSYDSDANGAPDEHFEVCGKSSKLRLPWDGMKLWIDLFAGVCSSGEPSLPTSGVITATFFPQ